MLVLTRRHKSLHKFNPKSHPSDYVGVVPDWPPRGSATWANMGKDSTGDETIEDQELCPAFLESVIWQVRSWAEELNPGAAHVAEMTKLVQTLDHWHRVYMSMFGIDLPMKDKVTDGRMKHNASTLVECIRLSSFLRGGSDKITEVVTCAIALAVPRQFSQGFIDRLTRPESKSRLPTASLVRRYMVALDMALCLCARHRLQHQSLQVRRFGHADSSP